MMRLDPKQTKKTKQAGKVQGWMQRALWARREVSMGVDPAGGRDSVGPNPAASGGGGSFEKPSTRETCPPSAHEKGAGGGK